MVVGDDDPQAHGATSSVPAIAGGCDRLGDGRDRQPDVDPPTRAVGGDGALAAELGGPLADRGQSDARLPAAADVDAVVVHGDDQGGVRRRPRSTVAEVALEWRVTLVSASVTIR